MKKLVSVFAAFCIFAASLGLSAYADDESERKNLALGKTVYYNTSLGLDSNGGSIEQIVDGNSEGNFNGPAFCGKNGEKTYVIIDLGDIYNVDEVKVYPYRTAEYPQWGRWYASNPGAVFYTAVTEEALNTALNSNDFSEGLWKKTASFGTHIKYDTDVEKLVIGDETFESVKCRYAAFYTNRTDSSWIGEIEVFGTPLSGEDMFVSYTDPDNGETNVSNADGERLYGGIYFVNAMDSETLNPNNITITDSDGEAVIYSDYSASESKYQFPLEALKSDTEYTVTVGLGCKYSDDTIPYPENPYVFTFTTGEIIDISNHPGTKYRNVAFGKKVSFNEVLGAEYPEKLVNGSKAKWEIANFRGWGSSQNTSEQLYVMIDLGNVYDIDKTEITLRDGDGVVTVGFETGSRVLTSCVKKPFDEMNAVYTFEEKLAGSGASRTIEFEKHPARYVAYVCPVGEGSHWGLNLSEIEIFAETKADFGQWNMNRQTGGYDVSIDVTNNSISENIPYMIIYAYYSESGSLISLGFDEAYAEKKGTTTLRTFVPNTENAAKTVVSLVGNGLYTGAAVDSLVIENEV